MGVGEAQEVIERNVVVYGDPKRRGHQARDNMRDSDIRRWELSQVRDFQGLELLTLDGTPEERIEKTLWDGLQVRNDCAEKLGGEWDEDVLLYADEVREDM
jgi:hypothetical protein